MHGFLMILFIVLGYLGLLGGMMARLGRNSNVAGVAAAVLLIYGILLYSGHGSCSGQ